ncbi:hypothetical protein CHS0354_018214 [Potamilus streckersoni]|uniref:Uncharacterized protein n=1 Tax=Potamilus streckersoni TaxID=2493646 RepID=A0AAE0VIQ4_9BIVA|nr:hypothetical protein CHS0354_018214 [Potamilus streckersoni]
MFRIDIGCLKLKKQIIFAEIDNDGLLGIHILQLDEIGLKDKVRKVRIADHYLIPGNCEESIDVYAERHEAKYSSRPYEMIFEPSMNFEKAYPLIMAATVVDINNGITQKVVPQESEVPEHLKELDNSASEQRTEQERIVVAKMLIKYQNTFSKDETDLGQTTLGEHVINTGNETPTQ